MAASLSNVSTSDKASPDKNANKVISLFTARTDCSYYPSYCEENVWKLCESVKKSHPNELSKCSAVFVSNANRSVPLWCQRVAKDPELPLIWDYHVILMYQPDNRCVIYDLDSRLPFPTYFHKYITETFRSDRIFKPNHHRFFRVIPAPEYMESFSSDRSHMKREDGTWIQQPPDYSCICSPMTPHNLDSYISMDPATGPGEVFNLKQFVTRFYKP